MNPFTFINTAMAFARVLGKIDSGESLDIKDSDIDLIATRGNVTELVSTFVVRPTIIISDSLKGEEAIEKLVGLQMDIFTARYTQSFQALTAVYGYNPRTAFELLSSSPMKLNTGLARLGFESKDILPLDSLSESFLIGHDESKYDRFDGGKDGKYEKQKEEYISFKTIKIEITVKDKTVVIPVTIEADIVYVPFEKIVELTEFEDDKSSATSIYHKAKAGLISKWDALFSETLLRDYKEKVFTEDDKANLIAMLENRKATAYSKIMHGSVGYNLYYQAITISEQEKGILKNILRGSIDKPKYKNNFLNQTYSLMLDVVDRGDEFITHYMAGDSPSSTISFNRLKRMGGKESSVEEYLKAMMDNKKLF